MGALGNTNRTLIRHDFKRALYRALLSEFPPETVREYFAIVPLEIGGRKISEPELFELLWKPKAKIPTCWDIATDNEIETFAIRKGKDFSHIMRKVLWLNNNATVMPGKVLLSWFYPKLESLADSLDSRDICFALLTLHNENWIPGLYHRRVKKWIEGDWVHSVVVFILDRGHKEYVDWDMEAIGGPQVMALPCALGMPPFEKFGMLADTRLPDHIVWRPEDRPAWNGEGLEIHGQPYGRRIRFLDYCAQASFDLSKFDPPDVEVIEISRDYFCPIRQRVVLHAGCIYAAPFFIHTISHRKIRHQGKAMLSNLIGDLVREEETEEDVLACRHQALLATLSSRAEFRYFVADESLTLNGKHFTKGIPAKIMKGLIEAYIKEGKREFEYRDFKRRFEISLGQKNANFEVRFTRLAEKLKSECPTVAVEKTGRGKFALIVNGVLEYAEAG